MDIQKIRDGINWITNGTVRKVMEDLCDELEKHELAFLKLENEFVQDNLPKRKIKKVVEENAKEEGSPKQEKPMAAKKTRSRRVPRSK
ncbi:MAG: hypothetical protein GWN00_21610 [Aliifodinibius sp.]|nr:hypothetical protein [Fodinibius sp.]NIV13547.1 hypothetical protein [Fodinibius sp.]NIY27304.1 hypothetical protein [Fodinibius sp.]